MAKRTRRTNSAAFKAKVSPAAARGGRTLAELAQQFDVYLSQFTEWKRQLQELAADDSAQQASWRAEPPVDLKAHHAEIEQSELDNNCLSGTLGEAALLSEKK